MEATVSICIDSKEMIHPFVPVALIQEKQWRFRCEMMAVEEVVQAKLCPENIVDIMLRDEESWTAIAQVIVSIQQQLRNAGR